MAGAGGPFSRRAWSRWSAGQGWVWSNRCAWSGWVWAWSGPSSRRRRANPVAGDRRTGG